VEAWHQRETLDGEVTGNWSVALTHLEQLVKIQPSRWDLQQRRGQLYAEMGRWSEALQAFAKAVDSGSPGDQIRYWQALAHLGANERQEYGKACTGLLQRFGQTEDPQTANRVAWACVLIPEAVPDYDQPIKLARKAVTRDPKQALYLNTLGATLYRAGKYRDAIEQLEAAGLALQPVRGKGIPAPGEEFPRPGRSPEGDELQPVAAHNRLFLAMAHQRLNQPEKAQQYLREVSQPIEKAIVPKRPEERGEERGSVLSWEQRLELQVLYREAGILIPETKP
jgi:tetratricopeptide (TPR) repeat protein